jgi:enamine deaminase RidA (YjgF/YER057c/UK114 family)
MKNRSRRNFLRKGASVAAAAAAGVVGSKALKARQGQLGRAAPAQGGQSKAAPRAQTPPTTTAGFQQWTKDAEKVTTLFNDRVAYGPLLFIAGIGYHQEGDIKVHTNNVLDRVQASLEAAGSSMDKVLKCNVYLNDLKDYDGMNEVFRGRFGEAPPVRTTIAGGIPGNSLVAIDVIAYI